MSKSVYDTPLSKKRKLVVDTTLYLDMEKGESPDDALQRLTDILEASGISAYSLHDKDMEVWSAKTRR